LCQVAASVRMGRTGEKPVKPFREALHRAIHVLSIEFID
jgi:hypothetical protein